MALYYGRESSDPYIGADSYINKRLSLRKYDYMFHCAASGDDVNDDGNLTCRSWQVTFAAEESLVG